MELHAVLSILEQFADAMEEHGIAAVPSAVLASVVDVSHRHDVSPVAIAVLVDPTEPEVVRERAFSRVAIQLIARASTPPVTRELIAA
jgi:hypothetical protein